MMSVGIVLVSHSHELAKGLLAILQQIQLDVPIAIAGGTDELAIGTSAIKIKEAIEEAATDEGVLLLFDLGSAFMNAEIAIELLEAEVEIVVADAPLVEGAYVAVVESGLQKPLSQVVEAVNRVRTTPKIMP
ncbi:dihydroxyacetone kinase phosphoryl donor subunit DhaM [Pullulanibacillus sp. KACC 23026]|nr:dihydroxyacetone kinase phosphoryl donor subunit DhaM [Pullulanibacillus sp. KACC 23026]WEG14935.1 dihydroxyacetone kinase phosphoryl donor subunit DhaM [Pullulanibacillus sp. KACC 23026]